MPWAALVIAAAAFAATFLGTRLLIQTLTARAILDRPNERSSHVAPTPLGAGLVVVPVIAFEWLLVWFFGALAPAGAFTWQVPLLVGLALVLAAVSWRDDRRPLPPLLRLAVQAAAVAAAIPTLSAEGRIFQGLLPDALDMILTAGLWLWMINLTNFMDGIDGITGVEAGSIGAGVVLLAPFAAVAGTGQPADALLLCGAALTAALAGFLYWNWQPARIFLGDAGSVPLGFLLAWLLFELAGAGLWAAAVLLPLYYLADASLTLLGRVVRRERILEAHRGHFYQRAARRLGSHARVATIVLGLNVALLALAWLGTVRLASPWAALVLGLVLTAAVLWYFARESAATIPPAHNAR